MPTVRLNQLAKHPGHDRTTYDLAKIAQLTLALLTKPYLEYLPIVAAPSGADGHYHLISGHRRVMAALFACAVRELLAAEPQTVADLTPEAVQGHIQLFLDRFGRLRPDLAPLESAAATLLQLYGAQEIDITLFEGDARAQVLALQAANAGHEEPDLLGRARSFLYAVRQGAAPRAIAAANGLAPDQVANLIQLAQLPPDLQNRIAAGELPSGLARLLADLDQTLQAAAVAFLRAADKPALKQLDKAVRAVKAFQPVEPLTVPHQAQRNLARLALSAYHAARQADPVQTARQLLELACADQLDPAPWTSQPSLLRWLQTFTPALAAPQPDWSALIRRHLPQVTCAGCPLSQLPRRRLSAEPGHGQDGPLGLPCRLHPTNPDDACLHGFAPHDPFHLRVPWSWADAPGVQAVGGDYIVTSYDDLRQAYDGMQQKEQAEAATPLASAATPLAHSAATTRNANPDSAATAAPSPSQLKRQQIAAFIQAQAAAPAGYYGATRCAACRHHTPPAGQGEGAEESDAARCAWHKGNHRIFFHTIQLNGGPAIPICRQYAPAAAWEQLIPPAPGIDALPLPRDFVLESIRRLTAEAQRHQPTPGSHTEHPFEFLTGRPLSGSQDHRDWFARRLADHAGQLSDAQLWTLFSWALSEHFRLSAQPPWPLLLHGQTTTAQPA